MLFAVVDIETTGGSAQNGRITEIAIVITDGKEVIDKFESLVDPGIHIPPFISNLTGITNEMVESQPQFREIAPTVHQMLQDRIFVAHNVNFDYSFVQKELQEAGFDMPKDKLCTVRYGRKIDPGHNSYSLGNLCGRFGIVNEAAHRAMGDTWATTQLLHLLLERDSDDIWKSYLGPLSEVNLPSHLDVEIFKNLPEEPGVYYLKNDSGEILYIGKAKNIKSRIGQHFGGKKLKSKDQALHKSVANIDYFLTGSEFIALLFEDSEIRKYWPPFNKAQKGQPTKFHLSYYKDQNNLWRFGIVKGKHFGSKLLTVYSWMSAREILIDLVKKHELIPELCQLQLGLEDMPTNEQHNDNFEALIETYRANPVNFILWEKGRKVDEEAFVLVRDNQFYGFGFMDVSKRTTKLIELEKHIISTIPSGISTKYITSYLTENSELSMANMEFTQNNLLF